MQSRTTLYVIDPTLNAAPSAQFINAVGGPNTIAAAVSPKDPFATGFNFMSFVEQTGGKNFYGRNDLNHEIEDSIARNTNFYTLSYVPSNLIQDGKYRKIDGPREKPEPHRSVQAGLLSRTVGPVRYDRQGPAIRLTRGACIGHDI